MTYLQILYQTRDNINKLIAREEKRKETGKVEYEQRVAKEICTSVANCKNKLVPGYKMCSFHLHKAARNNATYRQRKIYRT